RPSSTRTRSLGQQPRAQTPEVVMSSVCPANDGGNLYTSASARAYQAPLAGTTSETSASSQRWNSMSEVVDSWKTVLSGTVRLQTSETPTITRPNTSATPAAVAGSVRPERPAARTITVTAANSPATSGLTAP